MLRTNLATRPFYNVRAVHMAITALAVLVLVVTLYNVFKVVQLSHLEQVLGADASATEAEAARLQAEAARLRAQIDAGELERIAAVVGEVNGLIDRRTFSWDALLAQIEMTLPADVRITRIQPREQRGRAFLVVLEAEGYDIADVNRFIEALEATDAFHNVLGRRYAPVDGLVQGSIEAYYVPPPMRAAEAHGEDGARPAEGEADARAGGSRE